VTASDMTLPAAPVDHVVMTGQHSRADAAGEQAGEPGRPTLAELADRRMGEPR